MGKKLQVCRTPGNGPGETKLNDVQTLENIGLISLAHGNLVPLDEEQVFPHIVYLMEIHNIGAVDFQEMLLAHFLFQVFDGIVGNVFLVVDRYKFYIVTHAFYKQNRLIVQPDELSVCLDIYMITGAVGGNGFL